jgi:Hemerythrin HHE cation binding domain
MTIRQNNWTLGTFCETYCRTVTNLHVLEDRSVFSHLRRRDAAIGPLIDRLEEEHEQIADLLERVDQALVALVAAEEDGIYRVGRAMDLMTDGCSRISPTRSASSSSRWPPRLLLKAWLCRDLRSGMFARALGIAE